MLRVIELNVKVPHLPNRKIAQMRRVFFEELLAYYKILSALVPMFNCDAPTCHLFCEQTS